MRHFPKQRGLVSGFVVSGFGFGSFGTNMYQTAIANPNDVEAVEIPAGSGDRYFTDPGVLSNVIKLLR